MEIKIKDEILKEFDELLKHNNNDPQKVIIKMIMRRAYYLLNFSETILKLYSGNNDTLKNIREELYDIDKLLRKIETEVGGEE